MPDTSRFVIEDVTVRNADTVLVSKLSLSIGGGELLGITGPSGTGKSSLIHVLAGLVAPDAGRVLLEGRDVTGLPPRRICRLGVGRTFQIAQTFASMTVAENVQMALISRRRRTRAWWPAAHALYRDEALALLQGLHMGEHADRRCSELAYGDVKRVELAIALAGAPKLLLMDEPTAGMAPQERAQLMQLAAGIARARGIGILFTEHDMDAVFAHADRIIVLVRGKIITAGTREAIRADPQVRQAYLGGETLAQLAEQRARPA